MKRVIAFFFTLIFIASLIGAAEIKLDIKEHTLANGLKILMIKKADVPRVGSQCIDIE